MSRLDVQIDNHGTVFLVTPVTAFAERWVEEHLTLEGWQWMGHSFAVEPRCVAPLVEGMRGDGLRVG